MRNGTQDTQLGEKMQSQLIKSKATPAEDLAAQDSPFENMVWIPGGTFLMGSDSIIRRKRRR